MKIKTVKLGEIAEYINGYAFAPQHWKTEGLPIIRIQNLNQKTAPFNYFDGEINERFKVQNGDLLISWSASLDAFIWERGDALLNQHIFKVKEIRGLVDRKYLFYIVRNVMASIRSQVHGSTMQHITKPKFEAIPIPLPPLEEQKRIASVLDKADQVRAKRHAALEKLDSLMQSVFLNLFGDPVSNPKGWEVKKLQKISKFSQGTQVSLEEQRLEKEPGYERFLRISDYTTICERRYVKSDPKYFINRDDIVIVRYGASAGFVGMGIEGILANNLFKVSFDKSLINPIFLFHFFNTQKFKLFVKEIAFGAAMPALSFSTMNDFEVFIPPIELQNKFSEIVVKKDQIKNRKQDSLNKIENLFHSLQQRAFAGELFSTETNEIDLLKNAAADRV